MGKHIAIVDPFPRTLELIFSKDKFKILKSNYELLYAPKNKKIGRAHVRTPVTS